METMEEMKDMGGEPEADRPFGPIAAAFLAAGLGSVVLGVLTTLAAASESIKEWLQFSDPVGPLSGKTIVAVAAWLVAWPILHLVMRKKDPSARIIYAVTGLMLAIALLMTFPTFFEAFEPE